MKYTAVNVYIKVEEFSKDKQDTLLYGDIGGLKIDYLALCFSRKQVQFYPLFFRKGHCFVFCLFLKLRSIKMHFYVIYRLRLKLQKNGRLFRKGYFFIHNLLKYFNPNNYEFMITACVAQRNFPSISLFVSRVLCPNTKSPSKSDCPIAEKYL